MDKKIRKGRKARRQRRHFDPAFKAEAVRLCKVGDRTIAQVAVDLDLTETALRAWVKRAEVDAGEGPPGALTTDERAELARLRRENKRLQMEREILKEAAAFFAKENSRGSSSSARRRRTFPPPCCAPCSTCLVAASTLG